MVKMIGNEIWRGAEKIGWVELNHVFARDGKKLGYFQENHVFDVLGHKLAYIEGDFLYSASENRSARIPLEKVNESIIGGVIPEIAKCAIYVLLGA